MSFIKDRQIKLWAFAVMNDKSFFYMRMTTSNNCEKCVFFKKRYWNRDRLTYVKKAYFMRCYRQLTSK